MSPSLVNITAIEMPMPGTMPWIDMP